jgi:hypothetical protein
MDRPGPVILKSSNRASPGRKDALMMEGAGQLAGAAAKTFFGNSANFHFDSERKKKRIVPAKQVHYKPP